MTIQLPFKLPSGLPAIACGRGRKASPCGTLCAESPRFLQDVAPTMQSCRRRQFYVLSGSSCLPEYTPLRHGFGAQSKDSSESWTDRPGQESSGAEPCNDGSSAYRQSETHCRAISTMAPFRRRCLEGARCGEECSVVCRGHVRCSVTHELTSSSPVGPVTARATPTADWCWTQRVSSDCRQKCRRR
jgi:hypothetical protein